MTRILIRTLAALYIASTGIAAYAGALERPNAGKPLYSPPWNEGVNELAEDCKPPGKVYCDALFWFMRKPHAYVMGLDTLQQDLLNLHDIIRDALAGNEVPTIVLYSLPDRDCGGGLRNKNNVTVDDYRQWVALIADAVNYYQNKPINIIIEPGGLSNMVTRTNELCRMRKKSEVLEERVQLIRYVLWNFMDQDWKRNRLNPNVRLFIDVGGPDTVSDPETKLALARTLEDIMRTAEFDGVSINVGGRASYVESVTWGNEFIDLLHGYVKNVLSMVVDISRSGSEERSGCNAPGAALGDVPTAPIADGSDWRVEAALIIQDPSASDGSSTECRHKAPKGEFDHSVFMEYLLNSAQKHSHFRSSASADQ